MLRWIQWMGDNKKASQVHATDNGRITLCSKAIIHSLTSTSEKYPRNTKTICKFCLKAEEEGRPFRD